MTEGHIRKLDLASTVLLLLWAGSALAFGALTAPLLFKMLPRDLAASAAGALVLRLDYAALATFGSTSVAPARGTTGARATPSASYSGPSCAR